ncbi:THAP domain-containing protein 1-like [Centruroides vittatus]|uniref:THAP domain-containing protein 1-like n=1 Tax=Centruroides vittatus TaxID=120091 RepID=UPI00350F81FD
MAWCSAPNCKNSTAKDIRLFRFPADKFRRDKWKPTKSSRLCDESQFELKRANGRKLLKWNAIPILFDVPNPPPRLQLRRKTTSTSIVT